MHRDCILFKIKMSIKTHCWDYRFIENNGSGFIFSVSNISWLVELADILRFHNYKKHNSHLAVALKWSYSFHTHKNIDKHLSALFLLFGVHSEGKLLSIVV